MTRFAFLGDMGTGGKYQKEVSKSLKKLIVRDNLDFVCGLGDNLYNCGANSLDDPQFIHKFENPYSNIPDKIKFYMVLGNHDYGEHYCPKVKDREQFQIQYGIKSQKEGKKWYMPDEHYTFKRGDCEFFAINPNIYKLNDKEFKEQIKYILPRIKKSKARWKIAFGHQPWISIGGHGNAPPKLDMFFRTLFDSGMIDLYMCGDDHNKQLIERTLKCDKTMLLVVCGTGGRETDKDFDLKKVEDPVNDLLFHSTNYGVGEIITTKNKLTLKLFDYKDLVNEECIYEIKK